MPHWTDDPVGEGRSSPILCWADDIDADGLRDIPQKSQPSGYSQIETPSCSSSSCQVPTESPSCGVTSSSSCEPVATAPPVGEVLDTCCENTVRRCHESEHECIKFVINEPYRCGGCGEHVPLGTEILACGNCPFDVCSSCSGGINYANLTITDAEEIPTAPVIHDSDPVVVPQYSMLFAGFSPENDFAIQPVSADAQEQPVRPPTTYGHKTNRRRRRKKPSAPPQPYYHFYNDVGAW